MSAFLQAVIRSAPIDGRVRGAFTAGLCSYLCTAEPASEWPCRTADRSDADRSQRFAFTASIISEPNLSNATSPISVRLPPLADKITFLNKLSPVVSATSASLIGMQK